MGTDQVGADRVSAAMDVLMPQLGETVAEGKITTWFKTVGDAVKPGENLFEIETDKVSMEVPATSRRRARGNPRGGRRGGAGRRRRGGHRRQGRRDDEPAGGRHRRAAEDAARPARAAPAPAAACRRRRSRGRIRAGRTRSVLRGAHARAQFRPGEARQRHRHHAARPPPGRREPASILSPRQGSGPHGRIVARDIERRSLRAAEARAGARPRAGPRRDQVKALYQDVPYEEVPLDSMRRTIAARLMQAKQTIPHFYLTADVEIDALLALREAGERGGAEGRGGNPAFKLSVNDFVIKALALALQRVPAANAVWADDRILRFKHSDVGVAVAIEGGLLTPVIRQAETKSLSAISAEMKDLAARARAKRSSRTSTKAARPRSPISACTACASSPPSSIRRSRPSWRSAPARAGRSRPRTAASNSSAR